MRKHLYLITEHDKEDRVGGISVYNSRFSGSKKGEAEPITVLGEEKEGFRDVGEKVYLGYHDFEDEDDVEENFADVAQRKLGEVDVAHVERAGLNPEEVTA